MAAPRFPGTRKVEQDFKKGVKIVKTFTTLEKGTFAFLSSYKEKFLASPKDYDHLSHFTQITNLIFAPLLESCSNARATKQNVNKFLIFADEILILLSQTSANH